MSGRERVSEGGSNRMSAAVGRSVSEKGVKAQTSAKVADVSTIECLSRRRVE